MHFISLVLDLVMFDFINIHIVNMLCSHAGIPIFNNYFNIIE